MSKLTFKKISLHRIKYGNNPEGFNILYFLGIFFFIFPPYISFFGLTVKTVYLFANIPAFIAFVRFVKKPDVLTKYVCCSLLLGFVYLMVVASAGAFQDLSAVKGLIMGGIILFASKFYVDIYHHSYGETFIRRLFYDLYLAGVIHSVILILTFLSPSFKDFLYSFVLVSDKSWKYLFSEVQGYRFQGIVPSGFSFLSTTHSLLAATGVWAFYIDKRKKSFFSSIAFVLGLFCLLLSLVLIGRTGFVILLLYMIVLLLWRNARFAMCFKSSGKSFKLSLSAIVILIVILSSVNFEKYIVNILFAFEIVFQYLQTGRMSSVSTDKLLENEFFLPPDMLSLIFGTSNFGRGDNYIFSDVGYVLFIHGAGVIGMLISFSFYFVSMTFAYRYRKTQPELYLFILTFVAVVGILNLKDFYFFDYSGFNQIFFLATCALGVFVKGRKNTESSQKSC